MVACGESVFGTRCRAKRKDEGEQMQTVARFIEKFEF